MALLGKHFRTSAKLNDSSKHTLYQQIASYESLLSKQKRTSQGQPLPLPISAYIMPCEDACYIQSTSPVMPSKQNVLECSKLNAWHMTRSTRLQGMVYPPSLKHESLVANEEHNNECLSVSSLRHPD